MPFDTVNVYVAGDVLIDAGARGSASRILRALQGRPVRAHALTHAHPDHQGSSAFVCDHLRIPLWCGEADREAMEGGDVARAYPPRGRRFGGLMARLVGGPAHAVERSLLDGDDVAGFRVIETPGHTPGHVAFWRERDRVLILGDVVFGMNPFTLQPGMRMPPDAFTTDPAVNRASARRVADLDPAIICFGHGPPLRDGARFRTFVSALT
jgi:glyoxylase-like metal-dependent hydrolase (beta-lactamase superfamily II)